MSPFNPSVAATLAFTDAALPMGTAPTDGQVLVRSGSTITGAAASGISGSTGSVDNALLRANGTGGSTIQAGAAAILTDNATLSLDGGANAVRLILDADAGQAKILSWRTNDAQRFAIRVDGGDDDAAFRRYDDAGAFVANAWAVDRSTGVMTVGELALTTDLGVAHGGTGASTELGAKSSLQITGLATDQATLTTAMVEVGYTSTQPVTLPAASGANAGQPIRCYNASTATIVLTFSRAGSDTISYASTTSATSAAISIPASSAIVLIRESASVWRVVQPSSVGVTGARCYLSGGAWYAVGIGTSSTGEVDVGAPVAMTAVGGGGGVTLTTNELTIASGTAATTKVDPTTIGAAGQVWYVALSSLGLSTAIATAYSVTTEAVGSRPTVEDAYVVGWAASGVPSTSSQVVQGSGPCYAATGKTFVYTYSTNNTFETAANASNDVMISSGVVGDNAGQAVSFNTVRDTKGVTASATPTTSVITHLCITAGVRGSALGSDAIFGDVRVTFRKAAA